MIFEAVVSSTYNIPHILMDSKKIAPELLLQHCLQMVEASDLKGWVVKSVLMSMGPRVTISSSFFC